MSYASVEEDGDEIFTLISEVRCCRLRFEDGKPVYSKIVPTERLGHWWWTCDHCGGSYGEAYKPKEAEQ